MRVFWLLLLGLALPAQADTQLNRLSLRSELFGWEAVGKLDLAGRGFCTGTLVAPDLVLTAAHCLFDRGTRIDPTKITFRAGLVDGRAIASQTVRRAVVDVRYDPADTDQANQLAHDTALLQLTQAIPAAIAAPFSAGGPVANGAQVAVVSYARDRADAPSIQRGCTVTGLGQRAYRFSCDVTFGASGAPVFDNASGRAKIISIISRGHRDEKGVQVYGMKIAAPLSRLKAALASGQGVFPQETVRARRLSVGGNKSGTGAKFVKP